MNNKRNKKNNVSEGPFVYENKNDPKDPHNGEVVKIVYELSDDFEDKEVVEYVFGDHQFLINPRNILYPLRMKMVSYTFMGSPFKIWEENGGTYGSFQGWRCIADDAGKFYPTNPKFYKQEISEQSYTMGVLHSDFVLEFWLTWKRTYYPRNEF